MLNFQENKKTLIQLAVVIGICSLLGVYSYVSAQITAPKTDATAKSIVADCSKVPGDHSQCYETEVPSLYPKLSVPQIFDVVRTIRVLDPAYQFCHVLAHDVGGRVVAEDPSNWMNALALGPTDGLCSNGFMHGVIVGRFSSEVLTDATIAKYTPDFEKACEPREGWQPSALDQAMCYHGMGHLFDFITNLNVPKALTLCNTIAESPSGDYRQLCIHGVFMQIFQPLEPDDYALIAQMPAIPNKNTVRAFCNAFKDPKYVGPCLSESWPLFEEGIFDGTGAAAFCALQPNDAEVADCYNNISSIVGRTQLASPQKAAAACNNFPAQWQASCFSLSAQAVLEEDRNKAAPAIALCSQATGDVAASCLHDLVTQAPFVFGSNTEAFSNFCKAVPASEQSLCISEQSH